MASDAITGLPPVIIFINQCFGNYSLKKLECFTKNGKTALLIKTVVQKIVF
jgi:hypothetical protein